MIMSSDLSSVKKILSSKYTAIVILVIASIGVYLNTLPNEFVYDDEGQVLKNLWIRDAKYIPEIFLSNVWAFVGEEHLSNYYRPLMHMIYMIDYHIFGLKPWGFHLTNILLHGGVSVLLFLLLSVLINQSQTLNLKSQISHSKSKIQNPKSQIIKSKSKIINLKSEQAVEKVSKHITCHSEQSEESHFLRVLRPFTSFRVTTTKGFLTGCKILNSAFIAALLFAIHPIHTEAVAWIGGIP